MNDAAVDAQVQVSPTSGGLGKLTRQEAAKDGWFTGLPYAVTERVFDEDDFPVCALMASPECSDGAALQPDLSVAAADMLANLLAQRLGIDIDRQPASRSATISASWLDHGP